MEVVIAGAGIGGLTAALALRRLPNVGRIRIFEAAPSMQSLGVGINVQPSGVLALHRLGLASALEETATCAKALILVRTTAMPRSSDAFSSITRERYSLPKSCFAHARIVDVLPVPGGP